MTTPRSTHTYTLGLTLAADTRYGYDGPVSASSTVEVATYAISALGGTVATVVANRNTYGPDALGMWTREVRVTSDEDLSELFAEWATDEDSSLEYWTVEAPA